MIIITVNHINLWANSADNQLKTFFSLEDYLHEMSTLLSGRKYFKMSSAEIFTQHTKHKKAFLFSLIYHILTICYQSYRSPVMIKVS